MQIILQFFPAIDESDPQRLLARPVGIHLLQPLHRAVGGDITDRDQRPRGRLDEDGPQHIPRRGRVLMAGSKGRLRGRSDSGDETDHESLTDCKRPLRKSPGFEPR